MPAAKSFIDSNVLLYLLSSDTRKADIAENTLRQGGVISIQVLNEIASVCIKKLGMRWPEVNAFFTLLRSLTTVEPLTVETHDLGREIAERYGLSVYDSMIVAAALLAGCSTLISEDMQDGLVIDGKCRVMNPFKRIKAGNDSE